MMKLITPLAVSVKITIFLSHFHKKKNKIKTLDANAIEWAAKVATASAHKKWERWWRRETIIRGSTLFNNTRRVNSFQSGWSEYSECVYVCVCVFRYIIISISCRGGFVLILPHHVVRIFVTESFIFWRLYSAANQKEWREREITCCFSHIAPSGQIITMSPLCNTSAPLNR